MKRVFLLGVTLMVVSLLVVGCGIPQEEYDAVLAERDAVQAKVTSLQSDLAEADSQIETLEGDLAEADSQIETLQNKGESLERQLSNAQGSYDTLKQKVAKAKLYGEILDFWVFVPAAVATGEQMVKLSSMADDTGDAEVKEKLATYLETIKDDDNWEFMVAVWDGMWEVLR